MRMWFEHSQQHTVDFNVPFWQLQNDSRGVNSSNLTKSSHSLIKPLCMPHKRAASYLTSSLLSNRQNVTWDKMEDGLSWREAAFVKLCICIFKETKSWVYHAAPPTLSLEPLKFHSCWAAKCWLLCLTAMCQRLDKSMCNYSLKILEFLLLLP